MHPDPHNIPKSLPKQLLLLLGCSAFVVIGYFMLFGEIESSRYPPVYVQFIGGACMLFFGPIGLWMLIEFLRFRPALQLTERGIQNFSHIGGGYIIEWDNIKTLRIQIIQKQQFLVLELYDAQRVYSQVGTFTQWWMKRNEKTYDSPAFIPAISVKDNLQDVMKQIRAFHKGLKGR